MTHGKEIYAIGKSMLLVNIGKLLQKKVCKYLQT